jgi:maltooligosyltrehalose trehalohydrolase
MKSRHDMPFGAQLGADDSTRFRLWAPGCARVELELDGTQRLAMHRLDDGWHECSHREAPAGTRYRFRLPDGLMVPDPASRSNPDDVHGASVVVDPLAYRWRDDGWRGRPWHEAVVYELHVGSFTPEGSFTAAAARLDELARLGITAIELMPVADFPGQRSWGYDGVLPFAPDAAYGTPDELKALVDTAHSLGLMVLLDVVYNHFGPEGNYLHAYCPEFFNPAHQTPWGAAINFDGAHNGPVREFFRHNALYWVGEYHFDGLRLDAVHAIHDNSQRHIVCEIADALRSGPGREREVHLVLENERNEARLLSRDERSTPACATAQWNDDLHHAAHALLTGESDAYYSDFAAQPVELFARALAEGFAYQGQPSPFRNGLAHGEPSAHLPGTAFVSFVQNHDQIGNRAFGERISALSDAARLEAVYACLLLSPHVPMLFNGEEFAASSPFLFFCDFGAELPQAVSQGRRAEFARFAAFSDESARERIPDPNAVETFMAAKLRWQEREDSPHRERLQFIGELLALRHRHLVPRLPGLQRGGSHRCEGAMLRVEWLLGDGSPWHLMANLGNTAIADGPPPQGELVFSRGVISNNGNAVLEPGAVLVIRIDTHG